MQLVTHYGCLQTVSINIARVSGEYDAMNFVKNDIIMEWSFKITSSFEGKTLNLKMLDDTSLVCREKNQENEPLSSFCEQYKVCICNKCGQTRHSHHTKVDIDQAAKEQKVSIEEIAKQMKKGIADFQFYDEKTKESLRKNREKIATARKKAFTSHE